MLIAQRDKVKTFLDAIDAAFLAGLTNANISSYEFDSGEGKQKTSYRNVNELMKARDALEIEYSRILNRLCGRGVVNFGLKR